MNATLTTQAKTPAASFKSDAVGLSQRTCLAAVSENAGTQAFPETRLGHNFGRVRVNDASNRFDDEEEACSTCEGQHIAGATVDGEEDEFSMIAGNGDAGPGAAPDAGTPRPDAGTPPAVTVLVRTTSGPTYNTCGTLPRFRWCVAFTTSRRHGWLVQRIDNTWNPSNCDGSVYGGPSLTPQYWEAWQLDGNGNVPLVDAFCPNANDRWDRSFCSRSARAEGCRGRDSRGTWSITGTLYAVNTLPAGFTVHGARDAGDLYSTLNDPGAALGPALSTRRAGGTWNCCAPSNTHNQT